ncbi:hypothetical protein [uncultured Clostridium sp.]|uniref:hypothetical protein n=1 Tax=uncultured Clostridium sp. TaxID=59620 RepID=UPI0025F391B9|nr:hypothetical protein [uncultured Clostridium sp.]
MNKKEKKYNKAVGYYYEKEVSIKVNGKMEHIKIKKYRKSIFSAQKEILRGAGWNK